MAKMPKGIKFGKPSKYGGPLAAIHRKCVECSGTAPEVKHCISFSCHLWPYRFGCSPVAAARQGKLVDPKEAAALAGTGNTGKLPKALYKKDGRLIFPHKAIRLHCLDCAPDIGGEYSSQEVNDCTASSCPLYPFRFGVRPKTAAKRGKVIESIA